MQLGYMSDIVHEHNFNDSTPAYMHNTCDRCVLQSHTFQLNHDAELTRTLAEPRSSPRQIRMTSKIWWWTVSSFSNETCVKNFHEDPISSLYVKLITDRQTGKRRVKHNLLGGSNPINFHFWSQARRLDCYLKRRKHSYCIELSSAALLMSHVY